MNATDQHGFDETALKSIGDRLLAVLARDDVPPVQTSADGLVTLTMSPGFELTSLTLKGVDLGSEERTKCGARADYRDQRSDPSAGERPRGKVPGANGLGRQPREVNAPPCRHQAATGAEVNTAYGEINVDLVNETPSGNAESVTRREFQPFAHAAPKRRACMSAASRSDHRRAAHSVLVSSTQASGLAAVRDHRSESVPPNIG